MSDSLIVILTIAGFGINLLIIYYIVQAATQTNRQLRYMRNQIKLLVKIAQANGITNEDIEDIVKPRRNTKA